LTDNISEKDKKDWENFLSKKEKLPNKDVKIDKKISFKTRSIDLHGYTLDEANKSIEEFYNKILSRKNKLS
jgi:DNA-nicking Smr family endonuclease